MTDMSDEVRNMISEKETKFTAEEIIRDLKKQVDAMQQVINLYEEGKDGREFLVVIMAPMALDQARIEVYDHIKRLKRRLDMQ